ncbi:hypothetical protein D3C72_1980100 [compost metagenome]
MHLATIGCERADVVQLGVQCSLINLQAQYRIAVESQGEDVARRQRDFALVRLNRTEVDDGFAHQYYAAAALRLDFACI